MQMSTNAMEGQMNVNRQMNGKAKTIYPSAYKYAKHTITIDVHFFYIIYTFLFEYNILGLYIYTVL